MKYFIIIAAILFASCSGNRKITDAVEKKTLEDSTARVQSLDATADKDVAYYVTPSGKIILLKKSKTAPEDPASTTHPTIIADSTETLLTTPTPGSVANRATPDDPFTGSVRAKPKTSFSNKPFESYNTIPKLYKKLKSKTFMDNQQIGHLNERNQYEDRNVTIKKAYLYTITVEADNDLHLLIGNTPSYVEGKTRVFNAEISGVPQNAPDSVKDRIRELRRKALAELGDVPVCGRVGYLQSNHRITIKGSLFYDTHHASKPAKCREVEGESAWEMHPVYDISF